jgi:hypothetical protein
VACTRSNLCIAADAQAARLPIMPAVLTLRDNQSGAMIERSAPLAEAMIARDPGRYEIVEAIQPSPLTHDPLAPLDSRRRRARRPPPVGLTPPEAA